MKNNLHHFTTIKPIQFLTIFLSFIQPRNASFVTAIINLSRVRSHLNFNRPFDQFHFHCSCHVGTKFQSREFRFDKKAHRMRGKHRTPTQFPLYQAYVNQGKISLMYKEGVENRYEHDRATSRSVNFLNRANCGQVLLQEAVHFTDCTQCGQMGVVRLFIVDKAGHLSLYV